MLHLLPAELKLAILRSTATLHCQQAFLSLIAVNRAFHALYLSDQHSFLSAYLACNAGPAMPCFLTLAKGELRHIESTSEVSVVQLKKAIYFLRRVEMVVDVILDSQEGIEPYYGFDSGEEEEDEDDDEFYAWGGPDTEDDPNTEDGPDTEDDPNTEDDPGTGEEGEEEKEEFDTDSEVSLVVYETNEEYNHKLRMNAIHDVLYRDRDPCEFKLSGTPSEISHLHRLIFDLRKRLYQNRDLILCFAVGDVIDIRTGSIYEGRSDLIIPLELDWLDASSAVRRFDERERKRLCKVFLAEEVDHQICFEIDAEERVTVRVKDTSTSDLDTNASQQHNYFLLAPIQRSISSFYNPIRKNYDILSTNLIRRTMLRI